VPSCGAGFGFFQAPNLKALMSSAPPHRSGGASGVIGVCRLLGQASGAALVALCFHLVGLRQGPVVALAIGGATAGLAALASFARLLVRHSCPRETVSLSKRRTGQDQARRRSRHVIQYKL
jgi:DHA2 family multidrug resistance protein-like MFS transporter